MNKKAQLELEPMPVILGLVGGVAALVMARGMGANIIMQIVAVVLTAIVCYFIAGMGSR